MECKTVWPKCRVLKEGTKIRIADPVDCPRSFDAFNTIESLGEF